MRRQDKVFAAISGILSTYTAYAILGSAQERTLPLYPGAQYVTINSKLQAELRFPNKGPLTACVAWPVHKYITLRAPGSGEQVLAWYRQQLTAAGWQYDPGPGEQHNVWKYIRDFSFLDIEATGETESQVSIWEGGDAFADGVPADTVTYP